MFGACYTTGMSTAPRLDALTVDEYLAGESRAERKHEFVDGVIYSMVGGSNAHAIIATNITGLLHAQLRGSRCRVFNSDAKVRIRRGSSTRFYYPDASVICTPNRPQDTFNDHPVVVIEVLSESTRRTDENEKRDAYLSIDSLLVYVLVEQETAAVVVHRRTEIGFSREVWSGVDATIPLPEIGCSLPLAEIYLGVGLPPS